jgi:hypothetical protein
MTRKSHLAGNDRGTRRRRFRRDRARSHFEDDAYCAVFKRETGRLRGRLAPFKRCLSVDRGLKQRAGAEPFDAMGVAERQDDLERDGHEGTPCAKPPVGPDPLHSVARPREVRLLSRKASPALSSKPEIAQLSLSPSRIAGVNGVRSQGATWATPIYYASSERCSVVAAPPRLRWR